MPLLTICLWPQVESLEDMRRFMTEHMDFSRMQGNVTKHVNIMSELSEVVGKRNLLEVSEVRCSLCGWGPRTQWRCACGGGGECVGASPRPGEREGEQPWCAEGPQQRTVRAPCASRGWRGRQHARLTQP